MELRKEEIDFIVDDLKERGLKKKYILDEIVDHVCSHVESRLRSDDNFETAYRNVIESFGKTEFKNLENNIKKARNLFIFVDETFTPANVLFKKSEEGINLTAFVRNLYFIVTFSFLLAVSFTMAVLTGNHNLPLLIVFLAASLFFFVILVLNIFGRTSIIISTSNVQVIEGFFPLIKHFSFPLEEIKKVYLETGRMDMALKGASTTAFIETIVIVGNTKRKFGKALSTEQQHYIINVLKKYFYKNH